MVPTICDEPGGDANRRGMKKPRQTSSTGAITSFRPTESGADPLLGYFRAVGAGAPFFRAAHRAFIEAASFARPSGVSPVFFLGAAPAPELDPAVLAGAFEDEFAPPLDLAHRARWAAAIRSRASGDMVRLPEPLPELLSVEAAVEEGADADEPDWVDDPLLKIEASSASSA